jgi:hypothetical protein
MEQKMLAANAIAGNVTGGTKRKNADDGGGGEPKRQAIESGPSVSAAGMHCTYYFVSHGSIVQVQKEKDTEKEE